MLQKGQPKLNVLTIKGKGIDSAALDKPTAQQGSKTLLSAACGSVDDNWTTLTKYSAAEFKYYTTYTNVVGAPQGLQGLYATHCYPSASAEPITLQLQVMPGMQLTVTLYMAETYIKAQEVGDRVMDIYADGVAKVSSLLPWLRWRRTRERGTLRAVFMRRIPLPARSPRSPRRHLAGACVERAG